MSHAVWWPYGVSVVRCREDEDEEPRRLVRYCCTPSYGPAEISTLVLVQSRIVTIKFDIFKVPTWHYFERLAVGHVSLRGRIMVMLNGVMVIMFCLHEWAGWARWFDSEPVQYIFSSIQPQHVTMCPCRDGPNWSTDPNSKFQRDGHMYSTPGLKRRETVKTQSFCSKKRWVGSYLWQLLHGSKTEVFFLWLCVHATLYQY